MAIVGAQGVKPYMQFECCDCGEVVTGQEVIKDEMRLHIVKVNKENPEKSELRCEFCQEDYEERWGDQE